MSKKSVVMSVRIDDKIREKLQMEAKLNQTSINTLISQILAKHTGWDKFTKEIGFIFLTKPFVRAILEEVPESTIKTICNTICRGGIRDTMIFTEGKINITSFFNSFGMWLAASNIPYRIIHEEEDTIIVKHGLGTKFSDYLKNLAEALLEEIGFNIKNVKMDDDNLMFEVTKSQKI